MELEQAKEVLKEIQERCRYCTYIENEERDEWKREYQAIEVILKELDKKDKVIDEMIDYIDGMGDTPDILCEDYNEECHKYVKQYFYKKVEEQE